MLYGGLIVLNWITRYGEADRAINGDARSSWGSGSCTHTDNVAGTAAAPNPAWWQVMPCSYTHAALSVCVL